MVFLYKRLSISHQFIQSLDPNFYKKVRIIIVKGMCNQITLISMYTNRNTSTRIITLK